MGGSECCPSIRRTPRARFEICYGRACNSLMMDEGVGEDGTLENWLIQYSGLELPGNVFQE